MMHRCLPFLRLQALEHQRVFGGVPAVAEDVAQRVQGGPPDAGGPPAEVQVGLAGRALQVGAGLSIRASENECTDDPSRSRRTGVK